MREKPAEFLGTGHQCKDGYCHQLSIIFESVETFIRIVGLYLGVIPPICILVLSILWLFIICHLLCVVSVSRFWRAKFWFCIENIVLFLRRY